MQKLKSNLIVFFVAFVASFAWSASHTVLAEQKMSSDIVKDNSVLGIVKDNSVLGIVKQKSGKHGKHKGTGSKSNINKFNERMEKKAEKEKDRLEKVAEEAVKKAEKKLEKKSEEKT